VRRETYFYIYSLLSVFISIMMKYDENLNVLRHHTTSPSFHCLYMLHRFVCFLHLMRIKIAFENLLLSEISSKVYKSKFKSHFVTWLLLSNDLCACIIWWFSTIVPVAHRKTWDERRNKKSHLKIIKMKKRRRKFYFMIFFWKVI
jgi:hypothetical protein